MKCSSRSFLVMLVICFLPRIAAAEPAPPPSDEPEREQARQLYDEAIQYGKRGDYRKAKVSLSAAWSLLKTWEIAVNLGNAEMKLGQYRDAAEHIAWGIRDGSIKEGDGYAPLVKAKALLAEASSHIGKLELRTDEPGATISVDDKSVGKTPLAGPLYLDPGTHLIAIQSLDPTRSPVQLSIRIAPGDDIEKFLEFQGPPEAARPTETPPDSVKPAPRPHPIESHAVGARTIVPIALGGLTAVASSVALAFTLKAESADSTAATWASRTGGNCDASSAACSELAAARDARNRANQVANVAWVGAAALGAATLGTILLWPRTSSSSGSARLWLEPRVSPQVGSLLVAGVLE